VTKLHVMKILSTDLWYPMAQQKAPYARLAKSEE
jgi:hypothetical protein